MTDAELLSKVKKALNIQSDFQNDTLTQYIEEVVDYLVGAGIKRDNITAGIVARGVSDLWNYGAGEGELSEYFYQKATQLSYKH